MEQACRRNHGQRKQEALSLARMQEGSISCWHWYYYVLLQNKTTPWVRSPIWDGLPNYLIEEIEKVQNRSLSIIDIPKDSLEKLSTRRTEATKREIQIIIDEENHPCYKLITKNNHKYSLRSGNIYRSVVPLSGTERHKNSFLPRSIRLL